VDVSGQHGSLRSDPGRPMAFHATVAHVCGHSRFTDLEKGVAYSDCTVMIDRLLQNDDGSYWAAIGICPLKQCGKMYYAEPNADLIATVIAGAGRELDDRDAEQKQLGEGP
jgi:hypothetical protein